MTAILSSPSAFEVSLTSKARVGHHFKSSCFPIGDTWASTSSTPPSGAPTMTHGKASPLSSEHSEVAWLTFEEALGRLVWESNRIALRYTTASPSRLTPTYGDQPAHADSTNVELLVNQCQKSPASSES